MPTYSPKARMVHAKAPLRLGLAGGGTDVAPYCDMFGGIVLNATISLFTHCHIQLCEGPTQFNAADFNQTSDFSSENESKLVLHKAVYNKICERFLDGQRPNLCLTTYSDAPPGSGVGSSSSLVVSMVQAFVELFQLPIGEYDVARLAFEIERVDCGMAGGKQDQYAAAFGGFNLIEFETDGRVIVNPLRLKSEYSYELESRLLLYYTGRSRESASIIEAQIKSTEENDSIRIKAMHEIKAAAKIMKNQLLLGQITDVIGTLGSSWHAKKQVAPGISNSHIDEIAEAAMSAGANGLKISGAGGGGFMMIAVDAHARYSVIRALQPFDGQFFSFCFVNQGVRSWKIN